MELPFINLQLGWPSRDLLPASALSSAATTCLADPTLASTALLYGPGLGNTRLRTAISKWLSLFYQPLAGEIPEERICISGGASQNIANILQVYTDPGYTRAIWMIEPVYHLACKIFEDAGFQGKLSGVPEDDEGIDIRFLRERLLAVEEEWALERKRCGGVDEPRVKRGDLYPKIFKYVVYCVPTFSNPSAKTMSLRRREELVRLAREFDVLVITDDCYDFLRWPVDGELDVGDLGRIPPRLVDVDRVLEGGCSKWGNTVSNGTFSKLVGPGVRVGWCEGTKDFAAGMAKVGSTSSGGNPSQFTSTFIAHLLETNVLQQHINTLLIPTYRRRYRVLTTAITKYLVPLNIQITTGTNYATSLQKSPSTLYTTQELMDTIPEAGGFFTYITLPSNLPNAKIIAAKALSEYNLKVSFGEMFVVRGDRESGKRDGDTEVFERGMRLCWAWEDDRRLEAGVWRLGDLIRGLRREWVGGV